MAIFNSYVKLPEGNTKQLGMGQHCQTWSNMKNALLRHAAIDMHWAPEHLAECVKIRGGYIPIMFLSYCFPKYNISVYPDSIPIAIQIDPTYTHHILHPPQKPWWM